MLVAVGCSSAPNMTPVVPAAPAFQLPRLPLTGTASVIRRHHKVGTKMGISVVTAPGACITVVAHFEAGDHEKAARADATGAASWAGTKHGSRMERLPHMPAPPAGSGSG